MLDITDISDNMGQQMKAWFINFARTEFFKTMKWGLT